MRRMLWPHVFLRVGERFEGEAGSNAGLGFDVVLHGIVLESDHAAIRVVDQDDLLRSEQSLRYDEGSQDVFADDTASVAYDMRIALFETQQASGFDAGVHAGDDRRAFRWRHGQVAFFESSDVACVVGQEIIC